MESKHNEEIKAMRDQMSQILTMIQHNPKLARAGSIDEKEYQIVTSDWAYGDNNGWFLVTMVEYMITKSKE